MKPLINYARSISCFLSTIILLQSCVLYESKNYATEQDPLQDNTHIKVRTVDGKKYVFNWIDQKDGHIFSIKNTKVEYVKKEQIEHVIIKNPFTYTTLEEALDFDGAVFIKTSDFKVKDRLYNHTFLNIQDRGEQIRGIVQTSKDTATFILPREVISEIKIQNKSASTLASIGTFLGVTTLIGSIIAIDQLSKSDPFDVPINF